MSNFIKSLKDDLARAKIIIKNDYETEVEQEFKNSDYFYYSSIAIDKAQ